MRNLKVASLIALAVACTDCTPAQVATAQTDTSQAIDLTNAVCTLAPDAPASSQSDVNLICTLGKVGEQLVSIVIGAIATAEGDGGATASMTGTSTSTMIRVPVRQIIITVPKASAAKYLKK